MLLWLPSVRFLSFQVFSSSLVFTLYLPLLPPRPGRPDAGIFLSVVVYRPCRSSLSFSSVCLVHSKTVFSAGRHWAQPQCLCLFFKPREIQDTLVHVMWSQNNDTNIYFATYAVCTAVVEVRPCHHTAYNRHDQHLLKLEKRKNNQEDETKEENISKKKLSCTPGGIVRDITTNTLTGRVRVLHIKPFFLPVDIQHKQCLCRFVNPRRDKSYVATKLRHRETMLPRMQWAQQWAMQCHIGVLRSLSYFVHEQCCFCYIFHFSKLVLYQVAATSPVGGEARQIVSPSFCFHFFLFLLWFVHFVFVFSLIVSFRFYISYIVYVMPVVFSMMTWHCKAHRSSYCMHGNVVSLWRTFLTTELVTLLGLKNRHGHWLCWMSTRRKKGLKNTHMSS